jgi:hypothetical protein
MSPVRSVHLELLAVAVLAFVVRLGVVLSAPAPLRVGDCLQYHEYATALIERHEYRDAAGDAAARAPGYPIFLAGVYTLLGQSSRLIQVLQCLAGAATCVLLVGIGRGLKLPEPWPIGLGAASTVYYPLIAPCTELGCESLYAFFLAAGFSFLYSGRKPWIRAVAFGAALGLAALTRPEALLLAFAALALAPLSKLKLSWKHTAAGALALGLVLAPWVLRNAVVLGKPVLSSRGGINLYYGLTLAPERFGHPQPFPEAPAGLSELDRNAHYNASFKELFSKIGLRLKALAYAFNLATHLYPFLPGFDATFMVTLPFWLLALGLSWARPELRPMAVAVLVCLVVYTTFGGPVSRYRNTYAPIQLALAGSALFWLRGKRSALWRLMPSWVGLNLGVLVLQSQIRQVALWVRDVVFN